MKQLPHVAQWYYFFNMMTCVSSCVGWILSSVIQSTMVCIVLDMDLGLVTPEAPSEYFIHQESSLPPKCLQRGQNHVDFFWLPSAYSFQQGPGIISLSFMASSTLPGSCWVKMASLLTIPSTSTHTFLLQAAFNKARIMLDFKLRSDYPSTRNHLFIIYTIVPRSCWLLVAYLLLFSP